MRVFVVKDGQGQTAILVRTRMELQSAKINVSHLKNAQDMASARKPTGANACLAGLERAVRRA